MPDAPRAKAFAVMTPAKTIVVESVAKSEPDAVHRFMQAVFGDRHWIGWAERGWSIVPVSITPIKDTPDAS